MPSVKQQVPPGTTPRGKKTDKLPGGPRFRLGSPLGYVLLLVLGFLLFRNVFQDAGVRRVSYSQFRDAVEKGQFSKVQLSPEWVKGYLPENTQAAPEGEKTFRSEPGALPWLAYRVTGDDELVKLLEQKRRHLRGRAPVRARRGVLGLAGAARARASSSGAS